MLPAAIRQAETLPSEPAMVFCHQMNSTGGTPAQITSSSARDQSDPAGSAESG